MNNFYSRIQEAASNIRLSRDEKQRMRVALHDDMKSQAFDVPSPILITETRVKSPYVFFNFLHLRVLAPLLIVLVVLVGSGTAYAAAGALPGDTLYPIKINVNEKVAEALATTPQAKVEVHAKLAQKRLLDVLFFV